MDVTVVLKIEFGEFSNSLDVTDNGDKWARFVL